MMQLLFTCAICSGDVRDYPDRNGRERHLEPLCKYCEDQGRRPQFVGAFMDRRRLAQLSAIADALCGEANAKEWSRRYGRA